PLSQKNHLPRAAVTRYKTLSAPSALSVCAPCLFQKPPRTLRRPFRGNPENCPPWVRDQPFSVISFHGEPGRLDAPHGGFRVIGGRKDQRPFAQPRVALPGRRRVTCPRVGAEMVVITTRR